METDKNTLLNGLKNKINAILSMYETALYEKNELNDRLEKALETNSKLNVKLLELENKLKEKELADAFSSNVSNNKEAKERIDAIVREIDKCLSLLNV